MAVLRRIVRSGTGYFRRRIQCASQRKTTRFTKRSPLAERLLREAASRPFGGLGAAANGRNGTMSPFLKRALGPQHNNQGTQILARTLYKELRANGCDTGEVLAICTQII